MKQQLWAALDAIEQGSNPREINDNWVAIQHMLSSPALLDIPGTPLPFLERPSFAWGLTGTLAQWELRFEFAAFNLSRRWWRWTIACRGVTHWQVISSDLYIALAALDRIPDAIREISTP